MGEIDPDAYEPDTKCENCGNVDPDDMLYRCKADDLFFCEQCGDKAWNAFGNDNCVCPECHSTSNVRILGEIGGSGEEVEDDDNHEEEQRPSVDEDDSRDSYTPKSSHSDDDSSSSYSSYEADDDYNYSSSSNTSYGSGGSTSGGGSVVGWIVVIAIIVIFLFWLGGRSGNNGTTTTVSQAPVTSYPQQAQPDQTPPPNPYGAGNGQLSFYRTCSFCKVELLKDNDSLGMLPTPGLLVHPQCGDSYMLPLVFPAGDLTFNFKDDDGRTWTQDVHVTEGECTVVKVQYDPPPATTADSTANQQQQQVTTETTDIQLLSPADHSSYDYPRYTNVEWTAVSQADSYEVELQLADTPYDYSATSYSPMPYSNGGIYRVTGTTVTVQGMGKQLHRLRVKALQNNVVIAQTDWRYFDYKR